MDIKTLLESEDLFRTEFPEGWKFTWRLLTIKEYRRFSALRETETIPVIWLYMQVFERAYIGDPKLINDKMPLCIPISLGMLIMHLSGDASHDTLKQDIEQARLNYRSDDPIETMKRVVLTAFSNMTPDELDLWSRAKLLRQFVIAESVLKFRIPDYKPMEVTTRTVSNNVRSIPDEQNLNDFTSEPPIQNGKISRQVAKQLDSRRR